VGQPPGPKTAPVVWLLLRSLVGLDGPSNRAQQMCTTSNSHEYLLTGSANAPRNTGQRASRQAGLIGGAGRWVGEPPSQQGALHFRDRPEPIFSLHMPLNGFRIDPVCPDDPASRARRQRSTRRQAPFDGNRSAAPILVCHRQAGGSPARQTDGHGATRALPRQPGAVLPPRGAFAPVAPTCANAGPLLASQLPTTWFGVHWGDFFWRAARCHLLSLAARKSMKTW
jgi:hypothetical protein